MVYFLIKIQVPSCLPSRHLTYLQVILYWLVSFGKLSCNVILPCFNLCKLLYILLFPQQAFNCTWSLIEDQSFLQPVFSFLIPTFAEWSIHQGHLHSGFCCKILEEIETLSSTMVSFKEIHTSISSCGLFQEFVNYVQCTFDLYTIFYTQSPFILRKLCWLFCIIQVSDSLKDSASNNRLIRLLLAMEESLTSLYVAVLLECKSQNETENTTVPDKAIVEGKETNILYHV